jgi:hypothetical protein
MTFYTAHIFAFQKYVLFIRIFWIVFEAKQKENSSKKRKRHLMNVEFQSAQKLGGPEISSEIANLQTCGLTKFARFADLP